MNKQLTTHTSADIRRSISSRMKYLHVLLIFHSSVAFLSPTYRFRKPLEFSIQDYYIDEESQPQFRVTSNDRRTSSIPKAFSQTYNEHSIRNNKLVWIIDDEQSILDAVGSYLSSSGYLVRTFLNATTPLSIIETSKKMPDAIVCDINMPQLSGLEFLARLRSTPITNTLPFIFLTAKGLLEDRIRGYDYGTDGYLMKPFDPEELVVMLDKIVERKDFIEKDQHILGLDELSDDLKEVKELLSNKSKRRHERLLTNSEDVNHSHVDQELVVLTQDELKVLELLCRGYMNREIASDLGYSIAWVEKHLTDLYRKTGQSNRTTLVRWAIANDYVKV